MPTRVHPAITLGAHILTLAAVAGVVLAAFDAELFARLSKKDGPDGAGLFENLTVLVLLPGIVAGFAAAWLGRRRFPGWWVGAWIILWSLACIYFAGEEISWGQWYFGWETPEMLAAHNDQSETNLHNVSSWLDQKPRLMVELFIIFAGLLIPVGARLSRTMKVLGHLGRWVLAPSLCWSAAAVFLVLRLLPPVEGTILVRLSASELRELATAWFLALYLFSFWLRALRPGDGAGPPGVSAQPVVVKGHAGRKIDG